MGKAQILAGRKAVDAYRTAHLALHSKSWHRGIPKEHTPLLNIMVKAFKGLGFNTIQEFFDASEQLNIDEFGLTSQEINAQELAKLYLRQGDCNKCGKCCEWCKDYEGGGICGLYENKPQRCKDYPTAADFVAGLPPECSFRFEKTSYEIDMNLGWH
jgi:hypothetical protein